MSHREADDQTRQSAIFARTEALVTESASLCLARPGALVSVADVEAALHARDARHDYMAQRLRESISEGDRLISVQGSTVGQINALTQVDLGDTRFGFPVRVTARTFAGHEGLVNIEREVDLSGPIHDKGVLILGSYLSASVCPHCAAGAERLHRVRAGIPRRGRRLGLLRRAVRAAVQPVRPAAAPGHWR